MYCTDTICVYFATLDKEFHRFATPALVEFSVLNSIFGIMSGLTRTSRDLGL
jgi:hypothetical protein